MRSQSLGGFVKTEYDFRVSTGSAGLGHHVRLVTCTVKPRPRN